MTPSTVPSSRWRAWLAALLIFVFGFGAGVTCSVVVGVRALRRAVRAPATAPGLFDRAIERTARDLERELALTPEQAADVQRELAQTAAHLRALRVQAAIDMRKEMHGTIIRLAQSLPAEKRPRFRELVRRRIQRIGYELETPPEPAPEAGEPPHP